jgi:hypothetical protein
VHGNAVSALLLGLQVHVFQFVIREGKKIAQFVCHEAPYKLKSLVLAGAGPCEQYYLAYSAHARYG